MSDIQDRITAVRAGLAALEANLSTVAAESSLSGEAAPFFAAAVSEVEGVIYKFEFLAAIIGVPSPFAPEPKEPASEPAPANVETFLGPAEGIKEDFKITAIGENNP